MVRNVENCTKTLKSVKNIIAFEFPESVTALNIFLGGGSPITEKNKNIYRPSGIGISSLFCRKFPYKIFPIFIKNVYMDNFLHHLELEPTLHMSDTALRPLDYESKQAHISFSNLEQHRSVTRMLRHMN